MKPLKLSLALAACVTAGVALAHSGATGIVKERMDGMAALQKATRAVTPIMRGQSDYDPAEVEAYAAAVQSHSGEAMTRLFPEGSGGMPSEARDTVWSDWDGFEELAMKLELLGGALAVAAPRGLGPIGGAGANLMGAQPSMGSTAMMGGGMMGESSGAKMDGAALSEMSVTALFTQIGQTCSACHTKYRAEAN